MPELQLAIESAEVVPFAAVPLMAFKVRIVNAPSEEIIHTLALRAQIQIEVVQPKIRFDEQARLRDLFGEPRSLGTNTAEHAMDARKRDRAAVSQAAPPRKFPSRAHLILMSLRQNISTV